MRNKVMDEETFRKRVCKFFEDNKSKEKSLTVKHFEAEGYKRWSLNIIIKCSEDGIKAQQKAGSGTKAKTHISKTISKNTFKKTSNIPKQTEAQIRQIKACIAWMCKIYRNIDFVIDGESCLTEHSNIVGNNFYSSSINETAVNVKYRQKYKF